MTDNGWVKLHRRSLNSAVFCNANLWQVFCYCLMKATHKPYKILFSGKELELKPGQFITGRFAGAKECKMSPSTFRDQLYKLKDLQILDIKPDNKKSLLTVVNWGVYQDEVINSDSKPDNSPTTARHKQEYKEQKNINDIYIREQNFIAEINQHSDIPEITRADFVEYWTEKNRAGTKMKFELQKTFEISRRLKNWIKNGEKWNNKKQQGGNLLEGYI